MRFTNTFRALRRNTMRSILTALGIIIGVAAVITMVSIGNGAKSMVEAQVAALGQNLITVMPGSFSSGGMRSGFGFSTTLVPEDFEAIANDVENIDGASPEVRDSQQVLANGLNWRTNVNGVGPDYPYVKNWPLTAGAMFSEQEVKSLAKVAVIGKVVAEQLFPNEDAVGQTIRIRNLPFRVIGVLGPKGVTPWGSDQDDIVLVPYSSHMRRISRRTSVSSIQIQASTPEAIDKVKVAVEDLLTQRRRGREPDFIDRTMTLLLACIASVSLIVGGIGIMNIMLVSVTERTREIGIRLAIGAHGKDVLTQFLIEAVLLSTMGGVMGVLVGVGASQLVAHYMGWPILVSSLSVIIAVGFSASVGVFFGFYPARKAAQLDPIDALRYE